jgi:hypothetical protein
MLMQGVNAWNHWRDTHPKVDPDLSGANLRGIDLIDADLSNAGLYGASFIGAYLIRANLRNANLSGAILIGANLSSARLRNADLSGADLSGANLDGADFTYADLSMAEIKEASLHEARLFGTTIAGNDLRNVKGLETVNHTGPSEITISTIYLSEGKIPEKFLRGCGIPEAFIVQIPALVAAMQPIQFYSCFISYSNKDHEFAERLHADLQDSGVRSWYAPEDLKIGERIRVSIDESIRVHDKVLLILSKNSIGSEWVEKEVETAMERERQQKRTILFPIRLDDEVLSVKSGWAADIRRSRNIGNFRQWKTYDTYSEAFRRLLRDLQPEA